MWIFLRSWLCSHPPKVLKLHGHLLSKLANLYTVRGLVKIHLDLIRGPLLKTFSLLDHIRNRWHLNPALCIQYTVCAMIGIQYVWWFQNAVKQLTIDFLYNYSILIKTLWLIHNALLVTDGCELEHTSEIVGIDT